MLLEAAMVRCQRDRREMRYDKECINAREAVSIVEAEEEALRRAERDAQSEEKRRALRRFCIWGSGGRLGDLSKEKAHFAFPCICL